jgi:hypothetical protein
LSPVVLRLEGETATVWELDDGPRRLSQELLQDADVDVEPRHEPGPPNTIAALPPWWPSGRAEKASVAVSGVLLVLRDFPLRHRQMQLRLQQVTRSRSQRRGLDALRRSGSAARQIATLPGRPGEAFDDPRALMACRSAPTPPSPVSVITSEVRS